MPDFRRVLLIIVAILAIFMLMAYARGIAHHHGWQINGRLSQPTATDSHHG
ncbi:hypothetical protein [Catellatospora tritici]|uniref:hypothetical protein n=1 Tax=Catellatospora tritici TaxID=2851566 RepID=UPI001C2D0831|nr:hypothetical protein [Catellatospora tritici]MBV1850894.1 hypothetical protein [Catellatospora tritici]MBV1851147.1 hypothetical protein [Catellatospora tritici]